MSLKATIYADFMTAFKAKDEKAKSALSMLKAKITEAEKNNKNQELSNAEVLKVILSSVKQRKQSIEEFAKGGRPDLVEKEAAELTVLEAYLPKQMTRDEITAELKTILAGFGASDPINKKVGQSMGLFNKKFPGMADAKVVKEVIDSLVVA
jgi:uncharacterized protein YqeY